MYLDVNNLYGWAISQELPVDGFEWKKNKICQNLMKSLLKTMVKIVIQDTHLKIKKCNHVIKKSCCTNKNFKASIKSWINTKNRHKVNQFNQRAQLKSYIDLNTKLRSEAKNDFQKDFFKLMNNVVFGKSMENVRKHRGIKFVTTIKRRNYLVSEPNYRTTKYFFRIFITNRNAKQIKLELNKPVYLGLSILAIRKTRNV